MSTEDNVGKGRRDFLYIATGAAGAVAVGAAMWPLIDQMNPAKNVMPPPSFEVDLRAIPEGQSVMFLWLQKHPIYVRHRTKEEIERARAEDNSSDLMDPEKDEDRAQVPEWLVVSALCTHMACMNIDQAGDYGGWFCPCHGAHFDISGRIRKGPAPINLPAFDYEFPDDATMKIVAIKARAGKHHYGLPVSRK